MRLVGYYDDVERLTAQGIFAVSDVELVDQGEEVAVILT